MKLALFILLFSAFAPAAMKLDLRPRNVTNPNSTGTEHIDTPRSSPAGSVAGGIGNATIDLAIKEKLPAIDACYQKHGQNKSGTVRSSFVISKTGEVSGAWIRASTLASQETEECLVGILKGVKFPKPEEEKIVEVEYPFHFRPKRRN